MVGLSRGRKLKESVCSVSLVVLFYRATSTWCSTRMEQEISQTICYKFSMFDVAGLEHVWMASNDHMHTERQQVLVYTTLVGKRRQEEFLPIMHHDDYYADFSLWE